MAGGGCVKSGKVVRQSGSSFRWAFFLLPGDQRRALSTLYAYCRRVDDIVDETEDRSSARVELARWREILGRFPSPSVFDPPLAHELASSARAFPIRTEDLLWILRGVETDLDRNRYGTFDELLVYCDGVASAVGFASMAIFGADRERTSRYTLATGRALQLTNILRDVGVDAARGRIYLPKEDLDRFAIRERNILMGLHDERFIEMMRFQAGRIRTLHAEAEEALSPAERRVFPAAEVMRKTYRLLLDRIEAKRFNVFPGKIGLSPARKISVLLSVSASRFLRF
jgi:phytoene synthase